MNIIWYGNFCFGIETRERGEEAKSMVFFPNDKTSRSHAMEERAAIIVTSAKSSAKAKDDVSAFLIDGPGEYELAGFIIYAIPIASLGKFSAAVKVFAENMRLLWLPTLPSKVFSEKEIDQLGEIDILLLPLNQEKGEKYPPAPAEEAVKLMNEIEPRITIPFAREEKTVKSFLDEAGVKNVQPLEKFSVKQKDLPEETQIVQLKV
ncbi:MAG: hypothetical protein UT82_C0009G0013 [Parcubacteria group bacterium GW2011_GWB1_40_14]|nr:MAG: hypothetical protein UT82_C0009G0013 [Parcubacteria group bacterium GW2011_GWB1_40_14]